MKEKLNVVANVAIIVTLCVLLLGPSGPVGGWIGDRYEERSVKRRIAELWVELTDADSKLEPQSPDERRTIVEFVDYECPSCRLVSSAVSEAVVREGVTVVVRHLPLVGLHATARDRAVAAVCGERVGAFGEIHGALMEEPVSVDSEHWSALGDRLGDVAAAAFRTCVSAGDAEGRLNEDGYLAASLGIAGTPTFVTLGGVFVGAEGLERAVRSLPPPETGTRQQVEIREPSEHSMFDSFRHGNTSVSELEKLNTALFLSPERILIVDEAWLQFVDLGTGDVETQGGAGEGPGEFRSIFDVLRLPDGVVLRDFVLARLTTFSTGGALLGTRRYDVMKFENMLVRPVAAFVDGAVVFRDTRNTSVWVEGRSRAAVRYIESSGDEQVRVIAQEIGDEKYGYRLADGRKGTTGIHFGQRVLEGRIGERLVVAQTDSPTVRLLNRDGAVTGRIPLPRGLDVSEDHVQLARHERIAEREQRFNAPEIRERLGRTAMASREHPTVPANAVTPGVDKLFVDFDGRLWLRLFVMPGQDVVQWQVWDVASARMEFVVRLARTTTLLDAQGDRVLLHMMDSFGVDRVVIQTLVAV